MFNPLSRTFVRAAIIALATTGAATSVWAMRVSPMIVEMTSTGTGSVARIEVQNLNAGRLPFETRISRLTFDEYGMPSEAPADEDFLVFPPQGMLPQGARQVLRVQWVGAPDLARSQAYYVSINQLPIPADAPDAPAGGQVQVVYNMKALVVVAPPNAKPDVTVSSAKPIDYQPPAANDGDPLPPKVPGVEVTLKNAGTRHAMMSALKWVIEGTDVSGKPHRVTIAQEDLGRILGSGYIGAGASRIYSFPVAQPFGSGPITVKFEQ